MIKARRFYKTVSLEKKDTGYLVSLDEKPIRTPRKNLLQVPSKSLAQKVAQEWENQTETLSYEAMPTFSFVCTVQDITPEKRPLLIKELLNYMVTDLLSYRETDPQNLLKRQEELWNPWLSWIEKEEGIRFETTESVLPLKYSRDHFTPLQKKLEELGDWPLTLLQILTQSTGSFILSWAFLKKEMAVSTLLSAAFLERDSQTALWGEDPETQKSRKSLESELLWYEELRKGLPL